jgi:hypothetical protein
VIVEVKGRLCDNNPSMSKLLRTIATAAWGLLLVPLLAGILKESLEENYFSDPNAVAWIVLIALARLFEQDWFRIALVCLTGIMIGAWLDWLARNADDRKAFKLRTLGFKFRGLANTIATRQKGFQSAWPDNMSDLKPNITSAFISAKKLGLWVPDERAYKFEDASFLWDYLNAVGKLLEDRHFAEAKREAIVSKIILDKAKLSR